MLHVILWLPRIWYTETIVPNALALRRYGLLAVYEFWNINIEEDLFVDYGLDYSFNEAEHKRQFLYYNRLSVSIITFQYRLCNFWRSSSWTRFLFMPCHYAQCCNGVYILCKSASCPFQILITTNRGLLLPVQPYNEKYTSKDVAGLGDSHRCLYFCLPRQEEHTSLVMLLIFWYFTNL